MSLALASVALYGAGVSSTISPCVLPLVPGYLGVLVDGSGDGRRGRPLRVALFAAGAIGTFVVLAGWSLRLASLWAARSTGCNALRDSA